MLKGSSSFFWLCCATGLSLGAATFTTASGAQPIPNSSLSTQAQSADGLNFLILGGQAAGQNLFHSFQDFSIAPGGSVTFSPAPQIERIFSRVTGANPSRIDGLLQANTDLFLLNPNGILIGPGGRIQIGGSFIGTTAQSLFFADGATFGADGASPNAPGSALLTMSLPVGLQMGQASEGSGAIEVRGTGHQLVSRGAELPVFLGPRNPQLSVAAGKSLLLVGHEIVVDGGTAIAPDGRLELMGLAAGQVSLAPSDSTGSRQWQLGAVDTTTSSRWGNITLDRYALVEASGQKGGDLILRGDAIALKNTSLAMVQARGEGRDSSIQVQANKLLIEDSDPQRLFGSSIASNAFSSGQGASIQVAVSDLVIRDGGQILSLALGTARGGDLQINADSIWVGTASGTNRIPFLNLIGSLGYQAGEGGTMAIEASRIDLVDGGTISSASFGLGQGGDLRVQANQSINVVGISPIAPDIRSAIQSVTLNRGDAGDLSVVTPQLRLRGGGNVISSSVLSATSLGVPRPGSGEGNGGNVVIRASEFIDLDGSNAVLGTGSLVGSFTFGKGDAGTTLIITPDLKVRGGAAITSSSSASGDAGQLTIQADRVEVSGQDPRTQLPSQIVSSALVQIEKIRQAFSLPSKTEGNTGSVMIEASEIRVVDGGVIGVQHEGMGNAGQLKLRGDRLILDRGNVLAATLSGEGGNVDLDLKEAIILRPGSRISSEAGNRGDGGNVAIATPFLILDKSSIIANAFEGNGGNIQITSQGVLRSPDSSISASSQLGVNGVVSITTPNATPGSAVADLPDGIVTEDQQVVASCTDTSENALIVSGRGGLPTDPTLVLNQQQFWRDGNQAVVPKKQLAQSLPTPPVRLAVHIPGEAQGIRHGSQGEIRLIGTILGSSAKPIAPPPQGSCFQPMP